MKTFLFAFTGFAVATATTGNLAHSFLDRKAISGLTAHVYGIYTSSDPTCQTDLVATVPLSATPKEFDMVKGPVIGAGGKIPASIKCVILVVKNTMSISWKAGTYTTTSEGSSDSVCNGGGTKTANPCNGLNGSKAVTWPGKLGTDMDAQGLTKTSNCTSANGDSVIPIIMSTYSKCSMNPTLAASEGSDCSGPSAGLISVFTPPLALGETKGVKLVEPDSKKRAFTMVTDPHEMMGHSGGECTINAAPLWTFRHN